jgi:hypothetical protein
MLPIGQYEDGGLTLAWPGMLKDMYEGAVRSYEQGRQLPRVDDAGNYAGTPRAEPLDAVNAASIAPMAGVGMRAAGMATGPTRDAFMAENLMRQFPVEDVYDYAPKGTPFWPRNSSAQAAQGYVRSPSAPPNYFTVNDSGHPVNMGWPSNTNNATAYQRAFENQSPGLRVVDPETGLFANDSRSSLPAIVTQGVESAGLPMDQASRLARASEMGFDTDQVWYHGSNSTFPEFDNAKIGSGVDDGGFLGVGHYFTPDKEYAGAYGSTVRPHYLRMQKPFVADARNPQEHQALARQIYGSEGEVVGPDGFVMVDPKSWTDALTAHGYDGAITRDGGEIIEAAVFDPSNIRMVSAAFDPAKSGSTNLFAANPSISSLPSLLLQGQEDDPERRGVFESEGLLDVPQYSPFPLRMYPPVQTDDQFWQQFNNEQLYRGVPREQIPPNFRPPLEVPDLDPVFPEWPPSYLR